MINLNVYTLIIIIFLYLLTFDDYNYKYAMHLLDLFYLICMQRVSNRVWVPWQFFTHASADMSTISYPWAGTEFLMGIILSHGYRYG